MAPIPFHTSADDAMNVIRASLADLPRTRIVVAGPRYLRAESRSLVFRFTDDVEFLIDGTSQQIHFRPASRVGRRDFGVNRRRMNELTRSIRRRLAELPPK